jgi:Ca2+:H+ antiporter
VRSLIQALAANRLNLLLVAAPASWLLHSTAPDSSWVFILAAFSLVPLAAIIGLGTEELAHRSGPAIGGFLNATFGNAAELIIAVVALGQEYYGLVGMLISVPAAGAAKVVLQEIYRAVYEQRTVRHSPSRPMGAPLVRDS